MTHRGHEICRKVLLLCTYTNYRRYDIATKNYTFDTGLQKDVEYHAVANKNTKKFFPEKFLLMKFYFSKDIPEMEKHTLKEMVMYSTGETRGLQGDVVYLS